MRLPRTPFPAARAMVLVSGFHTLRTGEVMAPAGRRDVDLLHGACAGDAQNPGDHRPRVHCDSEHPNRKRASGSSGSHLRASTYSQSIRIFTSDRTGRLGSSPVRTRTTAAPSDFSGPRSGPMPAPLPECSAICRLGLTGCASMTSGIMRTAFLHPRTPTSPRPTP